ncbi:MAG: ABC transporter permease [Jatrophihabitantaceae bacterium]
MNTDVMIVPPEVPVAVQLPGLIGSVWARRARASSNGARLVGLCMLAVVIGAAVFVPLLATQSSGAIVAAPYSAPSAGHPFGTDTLGRDVLVRVFSAGRLDLAIAAITVLLSMAVGGVVGVISGAARRRSVDAVLMRLVDAVIAFPFLVLVLVLVVIVGSTRSFGPLPAGAPAAVCGIVLGNWAFYARLARGQCLALRDSDFVLAARLLGLPPRRILFRHLLPPILRVVAAYAVADAVTVITVVASLSYIGVGIQSPAPEWGTIMYDGRAVLSSAWWITVFPGAVLAFTGLGLSLVADASLARIEGVR